MGAFGGDPKCRYLIDIEHLDLARCPIVNDRQSPIAMIGKHLCGAATDLSLVCALNAARAAGAASDAAAAVPTPACSPGEPPSKRPKATEGSTSADGSERGRDASPVAAVDMGRGLRGVVVALCCHQVCEWHQYCNPGFFLDVLKMSPTDFKHIALMSSWATSGTRRPKEPGPSADAAANKADDNDVHQPTAEDPSVLGRTGLTKSEQEEVGRLCKKLINVGRVRFLEQHGYTAKLQQYVDRSLSLENVVLVATPRRPSESPHVD